MYIYVQLNHFAVQQKLAHIVNQLYFNNNNNNNNNNERTWCAVRSQEYGLQILGLFEGAGEESSLTFEPPNHLSLEITPTEENVSVI